ncbi:MAG: pyrroline-5-carboxylate reductase [Lachnospiraceae bacterium]
MNNRIGFIGCGNMGGALAAAAVKSDLMTPTQISLANRTVSKAERLAESLGGCQIADNTDIAKYCQFIFLGVKPQMMRGVLEEIAPILKKRTDRFVLVSMAAGLTMSTIQEMAGGNYPIIRLMPNTPVAVGAGMILYSSSRVTLEEKVFFLHMMKEAGTFDEIPETLIDAGSAVSGCGPAFAYLFMEALADGGVACGLPRTKAMEYAAQMLLGSAEMVLQSAKHPGELKDAVCSPAGSTIQGVRALENGGFRGNVFEAVIAAYEKTKELGKK